MYNNDNISKDLDIKSPKLGNNTYMVFIIALFLCIIFSTKIYAYFPIDKARSLWKKSQAVQNETSFIINADHITSYIRLNGKKDSYKEDIKFYKDGNKWRSEKTDIWDGIRNIFISIYDGKELHDYVDVEDSSQSGRYNPTELSVNKGMIIYDQMRKDGYSEESLEDVIADFNAMDRVINWYPKRWYNIKEKESPKIKEKRKINSIECISVIFSKNREACVSEDYGIAIYYKESRDESKFPGTANKEYIEEYYVTNVRNSKKDIVHIDKKLFDLPNIKPWHKYGEY